MENFVESTPRTLYGLLPRYFMVLAVETSFGRNLNYNLHETLILALACHKKQRAEKKRDDETSIVH